jgi:hypothetical protein
VPCQIDNFSFHLLSGAVSDIDRKARRVFALSPRSLVRQLETYALGLRREGQKINGRRKVARAPLARAAIFSCGFQHCLRISSGEEKVEVADFLDGATRNDAQSLRTMLEPKGCSPASARFRNSGHGLILPHEIVCSSFLPGIPRLTI